MPRFFIHTRNHLFHSSDDGADYDRAEDALTSGVRSALVMITDEVGHDERSAAIEISIVTEGGVQVLRSVVAISVSPLLVVTE